jgi:hypothetical protein
MSYYAKLSEEDGQLRATILTPNDAQPDDVVLDVHLPIGSGIRVALCGMPHDRALGYSTSGIADLLAAIAQASVGIAQETEQWYGLVVHLYGRAALHPERITSALSRAVEQAGIGWLNPIVLRQPGNVYIYDLALSDETHGRTCIAEIARRFGFDWRLEVKADGIFPT